MKSIDLAWLAGKFLKISKVVVCLKTSRLLKNIVTVQRTEPNFTTGALKTRKPFPNIVTVQWTKSDFTAEALNTLLDLQSVDQGRNEFTISGAIQNGDDPISTVDGGVYRL